MDNMTPESIDGHIRSMMRSMGWQLLMQRTALERDLIIEEGKRSRSNEKNVKIWAKLDGFDIAATVAERLLTNREKITPEVPAWVEE